MTQLLSDAEMLLLIKEWLRGEETHDPGYVDQRWVQIIRRARDLMEAQR
jgi:hypothetical protein